MKKENGTYHDLADVQDTSYTYQDINATGSTQQFKVKAVNGVGSSEASEAFGIIQATRPEDSPTNFTRNEELTGKTQVSFNWTAPADDGGTPVLSYTVEM